MSLSSLRPLLTLFAFFMLTVFGASLMAQSEVQTLPRADRITTTSPVERKSPMNSASMRQGSNYARVVYSQPVKRGRQLFGELVPFDKVWRLGANEATELFTNVDLKVGDQTLPAGLYSVYAIPTEGSWTIIINEALGEWGAYQYDEELDVLRLEVPTTTLDEPFEALTMYFDGGELVMAWGDTSVRLPTSFADAE